MGKIFPDQAMTLAVVDRLVHHATIFEMNVESYRRRAALDTPDQRAKGEAQAFAAPARSVGSGHDRAAGVVRGRALAHIARTVRAAAGRVSRRLPGRTVENTPASY